MVQAILSALEIVTQPARPVDGIPTRALTPPYPRTYTEPALEPARARPAENVTP